MKITATRLRRDNESSWSFLYGLVASLTVMLLSFATPASANHANFRAWSPCNSSFSNVPAQTRAEARDYSFLAALEGYQWGGGCWDFNDDTYGEPPIDAPEVFYPGEGPDCSGLVFKSWYMRAEPGDPGFRWHSTRQGSPHEGHGPWETSVYRYGSLPHFINIGRTIAATMDAFVAHEYCQGCTKHIGLVYAVGGTYGIDRIMEAKCEACNTGTWPRKYRGQSTLYFARRRTGWAGG